MVKTVTLEEDVHIRISEIRTELRKFGIEKKIPEIVDVAIRYGIDNTFDIIKKKEGKNINDISNISLLEQTDMV